MFIRSTSTRPSVKAWLWAGACAASLLLAGCGGGGGGGSSTGSGEGSGGGGGGGGGSSAVSVTLTGVAANGAAMIGATVSVLDATGADCGSTRAAMADGAYSLTLSCTSPTLPLFIEANGVDMAGMPIALHAVAQSVVTGSGTRNFVNITPLTNAMVAMLVGQDPAKVFQAGKASNDANGAATVRSSSWGLLSSTAALNVATTYIKTALAKNITDAGLTASTVNFFNDPVFTANKTGMDALLEAVSIQFRKSDDGLKELMLLSNRLMPPCLPSAACSSTGSSANPGSPEVVLDLTSTKSGLSSATPSIASAATTSVAKTTSSFTTIMSKVSGLEIMRAVLNASLTLTATGSQILTADMGPLMYPTNTTPPARYVFGTGSTAFTVQDGQDVNTIASVLASYGVSGYRLSSFMIQGCLDTAITTSTNTCNKVKLSALVRDQFGIVHGTFDVVAKYWTTTASWGLVGNGRYTPWAMYPVTWKYFDGNGVALSTSVGTTPNPGQGLQHVIFATDALSPLTATITGPSGSAQTYYNCGAAKPLCIQNASASGYETGDLVLDQVMGANDTSWLGTTAVRPGSHFQMATVAFSSETAESILLADMPDTSDALYPRPDSLYGSTLSTLTTDDVLNGTTISWTKWAKANPHLRLIEVRVVIQQAAPGAPAVQTFALNPYDYADMQMVIPSFATAGVTVPGTPTEYALWMTAVDSQGRRYISKIIGS